MLCVNFFSCLILLSLYDNTAFKYTANHTSYNIQIQFEVMLNIAIWYGVASLYSCYDMPIQWALFYCFESHSHIKYTQCFFFYFFFVHSFSVAFCRSHFTYCYERLCNGCALPFSSHTQVWDAHIKSKNIDRNALVLSQVSRKHIIIEHWLRRENVGDVVAWRAREQAQHIKRNANAHCIFSGISRWFLFHFVFIFLLFFVHRAFFYWCLFAGCHVISICFWDAIATADAVAIAIQCRFSLDCIKSSHSTYYQAYTVCGVCWRLLSYKEHCNLLLSGSRFLILSHITLLSGTIQQWDTWVLVENTLGCMRRIIFPFTIHCFVVFFLSFISLLISIPCIFLTFLFTYSLLTLPVFFFFFLLFILLSSICCFPLCDLCLVFSYGILHQCVSHFGFTFILFIVRFLGFSFSTEKFYRLKMNETFHSKQFSADNL